jgi:hypothetical protein
MKWMVCVVLLLLVQIVWMGGTEGRSITYGAAMERDFHPSGIEQACCIILVAASFAFLTTVSRRLGLLVQTYQCRTWQLTILFCIVFFSVLKVMVAVLVLIEMVAEDYTGIRPFGLAHSGRTRVHYTYTISSGNAAFGSGEL